MITDNKGGLSIGMWNLIKHMFISFDLLADHVIK
jgi:hypothetical protein